MSSETSSTCLSVLLTPCLSTCLTVRLTVYLTLTVSLSLSLSPCLTVHLLDCLSVSPSVSLSVSLSVPLSHSLSLCLTVRLTVSLFNCVPVSLSGRLSRSPPLLSSSWPLQVLFLPEAASFIEAHFLTHELDVRSIKILEATDVQTEKHKVKEKEKISADRRTRERTLQELEEMRHVPPFSTLSKGEFRVVMLDKCNI